MAQRPSIVGSIVERKPTASFSTPQASTSGKTGFPTVQHRSKSAFARNREELRKPAASRPQDVPVVRPTNAPLVSADPGDWREQISKDNEDRVAGMTEEERDDERKQIMERFGASIGDVLERARKAREKKVPEGKVPEKKDSPGEGQGLSQDAIPVIAEKRRSLERARSPPPSALSSASSTRPSSRADRKLRFAELDPDDVFVYESAPASPKRRAIALPPPDADSKGSSVSLGQWKGKMVPQDMDQPMEPPQPNEPEEGSAEYIRRRYFPNAPKDDPNMAWMELSSSSTPSDSTSSLLRFDLQGNPIPPSVSLSLPTHLGLHHHAEGSHAGYTLDDIFLLSRSTVPAQRATMLSVLARIAHRLADVKRGKVDGMDEVVGKEEELRKRILAAGLEALSERGSVGAQAIEVVWECVVGWDPKLANVEGVELGSPTDTAINTIPLEYVLPQIATILGQGAALPGSSAQLLSVLHRLAQQSNVIATSIVAVPGLLPSIMHSFILTPMPPSDSSLQPNPLALQLFCTLALSSRSNAQEVEKFSDSLLRFVTFLPSTSPYPTAITTDLLVLTLRLYTVLASYGLYSHIAGTAVSPLSQLEQYVISEACTSQALVRTWLGLVETWTICAIDPHQTTPDHDILWSQITGWGWHAGVTEPQGRLSADTKDWTLWTGSWRVQAAWLEGSKVNAIRGGEGERSAFVDTVRSGFESGKEHQVVNGVLMVLQQGLEQCDVANAEQMKILAGYAELVTAAIRLWLSCIPPHTEGAPTSPPFNLPFPRISEFCANLLSHPLWSLMSSPDMAFSYVHCRQFSTLLFYYLRLSRRLPGTSEDLWMAQAFTILLRMGPGNESETLAIVDEVTKLLTPEWAAAREIQVPPVIWERGGLSILEPFIMNTIRPDKNVFIGRTVPTPQSIKSSSTQILPSPARSKRSGLPLHRDWTMAALDHLLRSGESAVFKALPISWDASEVEITRVSLFFTKIAQDVLERFSLTPFVMTREEAEFACMKVFMLEHGQPQNDSAEEVFRDGIVERYMENVLHPYSFASAVVRPALPSNQGDLEKAATRFLGSSVPFFQYYTDFVALYDAISFSHPLFARLLLPPTSMRYALDYRRHLWCDFNHVLKTIRVLPSQVLSGDLREYLYPVESDPQILGSYLSSLLQGKLNEFMRLVALHHIAANIWPDLQDPNTLKEERAATMFKAVIDQGSIEVVREVVRYRQARSEKVLLPPACFVNMDDDVRSSRLECVSRWGGQNSVDRVQELLIE
ncbi:hypothetical protein B0H34DRAFT_797833 [Crassisporium funariophilum]|nr:hypothetical protein B0H34DRAFT_797833 [Crassisporium funariophilum]